MDNLFDIEQHARSINTQIEDSIPTPNRVMAPIRWYGGKGNLAARILPHIPTRRVYVEPYCGAASLFWHRAPAEVEVLNDLNAELINLWRVLQDRRQFVRLRHKLIWTPYSRAEFARAIEMQDNTDDPVERAWAFFVRHGQGFSGIATTAGSWGRVFVSRRGMAEGSARWQSRIKLLRTFHARLSRVQLDSRDALEVIRYWDSPDTVFYLDPPYVHSTRAQGSRDMYEGGEPDDAHHRELVKTLLSIKGAAVLSGYESPIYTPLVDAGWRVVKIETVCHAVGRTRGSKVRGEGSATTHAKRTEVLWINPSANGD